ncbi:ATP-dependent zinc metalloprotease FtsH [Candidatus Oscillochloris fontis]|uniref:ATP-dependent zinc metalloprotease FtsH n=1 Tax=Candidatus Oscillochloris fontis TaxID=2496868 RepID=UPI00101D0C6D
MNPFGGGSLFRWMAFIFGLMLVWNIFALRPTPTTISLPYSTFLDQVQAGNVERVELNDQRVEGVLKRPVAAGAGATISGGSPFGATPSEATDFTSTIPGVGDLELLPLLRAQGVEIVASVEERSLLWSMVLTFGPVLLFVGFFVYMMRQQNRGQQGVFSFGQSRAKLNSGGDRPTVTFAEVAGSEEAKRELTEVVDFLKNPERYQQLGAKIPRGVLLVGPPGTGKTLLAKAVAGEAGVPFFSTSASEFVELFVGVGASRVRDLFDQARRNGPAIVFIDELDAIGRQRGTGMGGGNDEREQTLNQILVEMDGFETSVMPVIIIAATNRPDVLDPALLRPGRFDRQVTVGLPDVRGREAILRVHMRGKPVAKDVDASIVARQTPGFAGADLANLVNEAALHAARHSARMIGVQHFGEALDKIVLGTERPVLMNEHERKVIAYHEAGHALVSSLLPESDPVNKVTIIPRGRALGVTEYLPEGDRFNYSRQYLRTQLATLFGGRAAEQVAIGEITTGAENDLQRATQLARRMVGRWGMSEEMGLLFASEGVESPFLGREMAGPRDHSEATAARLDEAVRKLLEERMATAIGLLTKNRGILDRLAQALLDHETIDRQQVEAIIRGEDLPPPPVGGTPIPSTQVERVNPIAMPKPGIAVV